jgi:hypothetical protein
MVRPLMTVQDVKAIPNDQLLETVRIPHQRREAKMLTQLKASDHWQSPTPQLIGDTMYAAALNKAGLRKPDVNP